VGELREVSIKIMDQIITAFEDKENPKPTSVLHLAKTLKMPLPHLGRAINYLQNAGLVTRIAVSDEPGPVFQPALTPIHLNHETICQALDKIYLSS
jgi:predicted transcriptional regulator